MTVINMDDERYYDDATGLYFIGEEPEEEE